MKIASFCISFYKIKKYSTMVSFSELNLHSRLRQPSDLYLQLYFLEEFKVCIRISSNWSKNIQKKFFTLTFCRQKRKKNTHYILYQVTNIFCYWNMNEQFMKNTKKSITNFTTVWYNVQLNLCILGKHHKCIQIYLKKTFNEIIKLYFCRKNKNKSTMPFVFNIPCWRKKEKKNN